MQDEYEEPTDKELKTSKKEQGSINNCKAFVKMDPKDIRNLQEAYLQVYNPQELTEEQVWEEVKNWVNSLLEEGYDLSDYTWDELYVSYFNEAQYTPPQQIQQPAAEVRKAPKKNTQNPAVPVLTGLALAKLGNEIGKTSLRRKKKREEEPDVKGVFEEWVTGLLDEGYDLSDYNWDEMYEIYNEARDPGVKEYKGGKPYSLATIVRKSNKVKPAGKKPEGETGGVGQVKPDGKDPLDTNKSDYERFSLGLAPNTKKFGRPVGRKYDPAAIRNAAITSQMAKPKPEAPRRKTTINASYEPDLYDTILSHLMNEGYADTQESAEIIMVNMSEDWRDSIVEEQKPLPRLRMAGQTLKKLRRGFEGARTAINSGETKDTSGGQIAAQKSMKDVTQAQNMFNTLLGHSKEKAKAKETSNRAIGRVAQEDPASAAVFRKYKK